MSKKLHRLGPARGVLASWVLGVLSTHLGGCATAPHFQPSLPIEKSGSLEEGLLLCGEYRVEAVASRPISLRPFLDCMDDAAASHPGPRTEGFLVFRDELRQKFEQIREEEWSAPRAERLDVAVHSVLRTLWRGSRFEGRFSKPERAAVLAEFPRTSQVLKASQWAVDPKRPESSGVMDPGLEKLRAGVNAVSLLQKDRLEFQPELRQGLENLIQEAEYLGALWEDLLALRALGDAGEPRRKVEERYRTRLETARNLLEKTRLNPKISAEAPLNA